MSACLRSVAARVRKSKWQQRASVLYPSLTRQTRLSDVTEGYTTSPSYSTGAIFSSANDTLRNVFPPGSSRTAETLLVSPKKRACPYSDQDSHEDHGIEENDEDADMALDELCVGTSLPSETPTQGRPTKPLPSRRTLRKGMLTTPSLPGSSMKQLEDKEIPDVTMKEEED
jgi:hypothetical protein